MTRLRPLLLLALCALASSCATTGKRDAAMPPQDAPVVVVATDATDVQAQAATGDAPPTPAAAPDAPPDIVAADTGTATVDASSGDAEGDFDAIYNGTQGADNGSAAAPVAYDPWEKYNRGVHAFNGVIDRAVARPLARAYVAVVPQPVRRGVDNFFDNLGEPVTLVNSLLQGNPRGAANALGRFLLNSTVGVAGLFDIATSKAKMPARGEDFGQTLAVWGWQRSRYLEVPFLGPRTLRDMIGLAADTPLRPIRYVEDDKTRVFLQGLQAVDLRGQLLSIEAMGEGAVDEYALYRDMWLQRRNYQINQAGRRTEATPDQTLPPYLMQPDDGSGPAAEASPPAE